MLNNEDNKNILVDSGEIIVNTKIKAKPQLNLDKKLQKETNKVLVRFGYHAAKFDFCPIQNYGNGQFCKRK
jgi:hypothetical protein